MPFTFQWTEVANQQYKKLKADAEQSKANRTRNKRSKSSKAEGLFKQVCEALKKLRENPRHPGLNSHPYSDLEHPYDPSAKVWESYAQNDTPGAYRIFWAYGPGRGVITLIAITPHP